MEKKKTALGTLWILELNEKKICSMKIYTFNSQPPLKLNVSVYFFEFLQRKKEKRKLFE